MPILTADQRAFFDQHGYLVVPDLIPREQVDAVVDAIWDFLDFDREDSSGWYRPPHRHNGMVEMYHHQAMWDVRQNPRMHELFVDLFGREDLWVFLDRANLKPPPNEACPEYDHPGMVHWDLDVREQPLPYQVQGVLYLDDTAAGEGGFQCLPGVHRWVSEWAQGRADEEIRDQRLDLLHADAMGQAIEVEAKAGDFIIWNSALPHGNSRNRSNKPRLAQYVRLFPAEPHDAELLEQRVTSWRERTHPAFQNPRAFPGDPRGREQQSPPAELTPLGRRLLGLDDW